MKTKSKNCPIKNKKLFLIVSISIAVIIVAIDLILFQTSLKQSGVGCSLSRLFKNINCSLINKKDNNVIKEGGFTLTTNYLGDNKWEYKVTGQLPNPCYSTEVTELVAESYPEQVTIALVMKEPDPNTMCTQVIKDFEYKGSFSASKNATVQFNVITGNIYY